VYCTVVRTEYNVFRMCTCSHRSVQERIHRSWSLGDARLGHVSFAGRAGGGQLNHRRILGAYSVCRIAESRAAARMYEIPAGLPGVLHVCAPGRGQALVAGALRPLSTRAHTHAFLIRSRAFGPEPDTVARECDPSSAPPAGMADRLARTAGCTCMAAQPARQQQ
jgi:hypothetical protein